MNPILVDTTLAFGFTAANSSTSCAGGDPLMAKCKLSPILVTVIVLLSVAGPAFAHHGFGVEFDEKKCTEMVGTFTSFDWSNPHAYFYMDVRDASGKVIPWTLESISLSSLRRSGTTRQDFIDAVGKSVTVR